MERPDKRLKLINLPDFDCLNDLNNRICEKASIFSLCCGGMSSRRHKYNGAMGEILKVLPKGITLGN